MITAETDNCISTVCAHPHIPGTRGLPVRGLAFLVLGVVPGGWMDWLFVLSGSREREELNPSFYWKMVKEVIKEESFFHYLEEVVTYSVSWDLEKSWLQW